MNNPFDGVCLRDIIFVERIVKEFRDWHPNPLQHRSDGGRTRQRLNHSWVIGKLHSGYIEALKIMNRTKQS